MTKAQHRDPRLHGLSSDHHHALVLARRVRRACEQDDADATLIAALDQQFQRELQPHFRVEEELLLPALARVGQQALAARTATEHERLRALLDSARTGDLEALRQFALLLEAHVRFEERELFVACQAQLDGAVLDAVALRAPKS